MRLELLTKTTGWYGAHSGYYERIPEQIARLHPDCRVTRPVSDWRTRAAGKLIAAFRGLPVRNQSITFAEELFSRRIRGGDRAGLMLCAEDNFLLLKRWEKAPRHLVATIHYPPVLMEPALVDSIRRLSSAIVLYRRDLEYFESLVGKGRVAFVPHGVDLDFFRPARTSVANEPRLAYVGQFGRDTAMFARVVPRLLERHPSMVFDVVVARKDFTDQHLATLRSKDRVHFHYGIPDEQLLGIYQNATALLLPMKASGANNAIVEAISCGLPVITTDVGGIRDYGGGTLFPIVPEGDDDALFDLALEHVTAAGKFESQRKNLRAFAEAQLAWAATAQTHIDVCRLLAGAG